MAAISEIWINCYSSATVRPIWMTFCILMHIGPPNPKESFKKSIFKKSKMADGGNLDNRKIVISQKPFG